MSITLTSLVVMVGDRLKRAQVLHVVCRQCVLRRSLDHEAVIKASGESAKAYAAKHELSLHALYQARKRLRAMGLLDAARRRRSDCKPAMRPASFSKVELTTPRTARAEFRLSLPNGLVLEWSGSELPLPVVELVERLTQPR